MAIFSGVNASDRVEEERVVGGNRGPSSGVAEVGVRRGRPLVGAQEQYGETEA